ncbi:MAG: alginate export family protein [Candidatus Riflebacteria bacterium]|nr:alginate export family protein [Candidatus Riflebacteria bacterium]
MGSTYRRTWTGVALGLLLALPGQLTAQTAPPGVVQQREAVERLDQPRGQVVNEVRFFGDVATVRKGTEFGGWTSVTALTCSEIDHDKTTQDPVNQVLLFDQRLWVRHVHSSRSHAYLRLRKLNFDVNTAPGAATLDLATKEQLDVDLAHLEFPVGATQLRLGRLYLRVGRGLVLSDVLDGVRARYSSSAGVTVEGFAGTTLHRSDNPDYQVAGFDRGHNDRLFLALEGQYVLPSNVRVFAYAVDQTDRTKSENPAQNLLDFRYQSSYMGGGLEGWLGKRTQYAVELVHESGSSNSTRTPPGRAVIDAYAATASLWHLFEGETFPTLSFDYAIGSGDANRLSVTDSMNAGAIAPLGDHNFQYFGRFEGGLALAPLLSNLEVFRLGFQFKPLAEYLEAPTDLVLGLKVSSYHKDQITCPISDVLATLPNAQVGYGSDLYGAWKALSDVDVLVEYGAFKPGPAYPVTNRDTTHKFAATLTIAY